MPWLGNCTTTDREGWRRQDCRRQRDARLACSVISKVFGGVTGFVIVNRSVVIIVMVRGTCQMVDFMRDVECTCRRIPPALHGKAMQRQKQHQKNANKTTHGN